MQIHTPQVILLVLLVLGLGISLAKDGEPRPSPDCNFWRELLNALSVEH